MKAYTRQLLGRCALSAGLLGVCLTLSVTGWGQSEQNAAETSALAALSFRFVGPPMGNRASAVVGEPGNPMVVYEGAASGGIWKTEDAGVTWRPIFDRTDVAAIGALAVAPSEHNIVWAGTGEPWIIRVDYPMGNGVYKSTDAGGTWQHMGLEGTGRIARILVDQHDADRVFACAPGQLYKPGQQQGIFRTLDGGKTWQQVLFVNDQTGCSELTMDPRDPNTLFAGMWQAQIRTWDLHSGGTGGGVYVTHDGGDHWTKLSGNGLPPADEPVGKTAVQIAPNDPSRVYALIQEKPSPALYRSSNAGRTWTLVNRMDEMDERETYYTRFTVSPDNENLLYFVSVFYSLSADAGETLVWPRSAAGRPEPTGGSVLGQASGGGDNHDIWIDPTNASRIMVANDGGVTISLNHGHTFQRVVLPIAQIYHVFTDDEIPYHIMGNRQDGNAYRGPSRTLYGVSGSGSISASEWTDTGGGESGFSMPDPTDSNIVWSGNYDNMLTRMDYRTGQARDVSVWPVSTYGTSPADRKYRFNWTFPIAIDSLDHNRVYAGSQYVHMTVDGGQSWKVISPDLTLNDKSHEQSSGGVTYDTLSFDGATLFAIAPSPLKEGLIWTGSDDGQVNVTEDGGQHWKNVTPNIPNLPPWGTITNIEASHFDAGTAYITANLELVGNYDAYVYKTIDYGHTWTFISGSVPKSVNSSAHCVIEDPKRKGMLYLGTDNSVYVSWDDGTHWTQLRNGMPPAPVHWLTIQPRFNDLVVATYGRGIWILDDVAPLREYDTARQGDAYLFKPRPAYRFRRISAVRGSEGGGNLGGENPPYGADINFWLKSPQKDVVMSVLSADNKTIRTLKVQGHAGLNRVWWDLRYEPAETVRLRTPPPDAPWVKNGPEGWRPVVVIYLADARDPEPGPIVAPGTYSVRLQVGEQQYTAPLEILPDPHSLGTAATLREQAALTVEVQGELTEVARMINLIEWDKKQLADLQDMLDSEGAKDASPIQRAKDLNEKLLAVEAKLVDIHLTGAREDSIRHPVELYDELVKFYDSFDGRVGSGGDAADLGPTTQQMAVNDMYKKQIAELQAEFQELRSKDILAFNSLLTQNHLAIQIQP